MINAANLCVQVHILEIEVKSHGEQFRWLTFRLSKFLLIWCVFFPVNLSFNWVLSNTKKAADSTEWSLYIGMLWWTLYSSR